VRLVRSAEHRGDVAAAGYAHAVTQSWGAVFDRLFADYRAAAGVVG
jgi:hypothetical protein